MFLSEGQQFTRQMGYGTVLDGDGLADATPLLLDATYYGGYGLQLSGKYAAYSAIYKGQLWPYAIITKLSRLTARLPLRVYVPDDRNGSVVVPSTDPLAALLAKPNPRLDPFALWQWTSATVELYGEAMWLKLRSPNGTVRELHPMHPTNLLIRKLDDGTKVYLYTAGQGQQPVIPAIPEADVVHFRGYTPDNLSRGMSPCEPLRMTLLAEDAARRASAAMWTNGARPAVALSHPGSLTDAAAKRLKATFEATHAGVDNWAQAVVLEEGMTPHIMQLNAEELQYIQSRQINREECCAAWDIPPPAMHILDHATYSNIVEQNRAVYRDTMPPRLAMLEAALSRQLVPDFPQSAASGAFCRFYLDDVLRGSPDERRAANAQAISTGQMTPAEARAEDNLPFMAGSDRLLVNAAIIPLGVSEAVSHGTGTDVQEAPQKIKAVQPAVPLLGAASLRKVTGRLSAVTSIDTVDKDALVANLPAGDASTVIAFLTAAQARGVDIATLSTWLRASASEEAPNG